MPMASLRLKPSVDTEKTYALNEAGISVSQLIRFKDGLPEKLGGWTKFYPFSLSGVPKDIHPWGDLNSRLASRDRDDATAGRHHQRVVARHHAANADSDFPPDFSTTINTPTVTVDDPNIANVTTYDSVFFNTPVSVGGLILRGVYPIDTIGGATSTTSATIRTRRRPSNAGDVPEFVTRPTAARSSRSTFRTRARGRKPFTFPISTAWAA
jgi:hypothetical protein